jgi:hypothetical protein
LAGHTFVRRAISGDISRHGSFLQVGLVDVLLLVDLVHGLLAGVIGEHLGIVCGLRRVDDVRTGLVLHVFLAQDLLHIRLLLLRGGIGYSRPPGNGHGLVCLGTPLRICRNWSEWSACAALGCWHQRRWPL